MLVTDFAYRDMEMQDTSLRDRLRRLVRRLTGRHSPPEIGLHPVTQPGPTPVPALRLISAPDVLPAGHGDPAPVLVPDFRWRRHPLLRKVDAKATPRSLPNASPGARSAATRGLFLARSGKFLEAREAFALAAREPEVDLTAIPGFWNLPRGGMQAATGAYEDNERYRDAAALGARLRLLYRPRALAVVPSTPRSTRSASGT